MQKLITIPLLALYVLASLGYHGVSHFCSDEFIGLEFFSSDEEDLCDESACCSLPGEQEECCTDVEFALLFEAERMFADVSSRIVVKVPVVFPPRYFNADHQVSIQENWKPDPPSDFASSASTPLYLRHQSLIFYG